MLACWAQMSCQLLSDQYEWETFFSPYIITIQVEAGYYHFTTTLQLKTIACDLATTEKHHILLLYWINGTQYWTCIFVSRVTLWFYLN